MRHLPPLLLMVIGCALWHLEAPLPGTPQVIPGLWPTDVAADRHGTLYVRDHNGCCVWIVEGWRKQRVFGPAMYFFGPGSLRTAGGGDGSVYLVDPLERCAWRLLPQGSWQVAPIDEARRPTDSPGPPDRYLLVSVPGSYRLGDVYVAKSDRRGRCHAVLTGHRVVRR